MLVKESEEDLFDLGADISSGARSVWNTNLQTHHHHPHHRPHHHHSHHPHGILTRKHIILIHMLIIDLIIIMKCQPANHTGRVEAQYAPNPPSPLSMKNCKY